MMFNALKFVEPFGCVKCASMCQLKAPVVYSPRAGFAEHRLQTGLNRLNMAEHYHDFSYLFALFITFCTVKACQITVFYRVTGTGHRPLVQVLAIDFFQIA